MFDRELQKIVEETNTEFLEQAKKRAKQVTKDEFKTEFEQAIPKVDFSLFSIEALEKFITEATLDYTPESEEFQNYLTDIGAMQLDEKNNIFRPTGMGVLLFGKNPRAKYKQAALKGYQFIKLKETITRKEYQEHFGFKSNKKAERHLKKMVDLKLIDRKGLARSTYYEIITT